MSTLPIDGLDLMNFANSLDTGYLKMWKANGMIETLRLIPDIYTDRERLFKYVHNCLSMEGFSDGDVERVVNWLVGYLMVDL